MKSLKDYETPNRPTVKVTPNAPKKKMKLRKNKRKNRGIGWFKDIISECSTIFCNPNIMASRKLKDLNKAIKGDSTNTFSSTNVANFMKFIYFTSQSCSVCFERKWELKACANCYNTICTDCFSKLWENSFITCPLCRASAPFIFNNSISKETQINVDNALEEHKFENITMMNSFNLEQRSIFCIPPQNSQNEPVEILNYPKPSVSNFNPNPIMSMQHRMPSCKNGVHINIINNENCACLLYTYWIKSPIHRAISKCFDSPTTDFKHLLIFNEKGECKTNFEVSNTWGLLFPRPKNKCSICNLEINITAISCTESIHSFHSYCYIEMVFETIKYLKNKKINLEETNVKNLGQVPSLMIFCPCSKCKGFIF